jgi:energy-coupling factor transporter ATP-binding protein EcfA2
MNVEVTVSVPIVETPRVQQVCGIFDIPPAEKSERTWSAVLPLEEHEWNVGLIYGPSGCGKSTIARKLWGKLIDRRMTWPKDRTVVDAFPSSMKVKEIVELLGSVGFSSPPSWLRPFQCLSNGEQFRVSLARLLAESPELSVVDEFTSIVDRTVARIGSAALAKTVRKRGGQFVAVSCHDDIIEWLDPDWTFSPADGAFQWRLERRRRPEIKIDVAPVERDAWRIFGQHHYLSSKLSPVSKCFLARIEGRPAAFVSVTTFPHPRVTSWREHRTVCLPDFQGVGVGNAVSELIASAFAATGRRYISTTSHPAMIRHRARSRLWRMNRRPSMVPRAGHGRTKNHSERTQRASHSFDRVTAGFMFVGPANADAARSLGILR